MSKSRADEKSGNRNCLKRILSCIRFLTLQGKSFLAKKHDPKRLQSSPKRIKTHLHDRRDAKKKYRGRPLTIEWNDYPFVLSTSSCLRHTTVSSVGPL